LATRPGSFAIHARRIVAHYTKTADQARLAEEGANILSTKVSNGGENRNEIKGRQAEHSPSSPQRLRLRNTDRPSDSPKWAPRGNN
jgi:hypothetical protein